MKNIYILGQVKGSSRSQFIIKYLLDNGFNLYYNSISIQNLYTEKLIIKILKRLLSYLEKLFFFPIEVYNIIISEYVFLLAMCNNYQLLFNIAKFFKKNIISDFYISYYDTFVIDWKDINPKSRKARRLYRWDKNIISSSHTVLFLNETEANRYLTIVNEEFNSTKIVIAPLTISSPFFCSLPYINMQSDVFKICWWGRYIPLHGLDKIIQAIYIVNSTSNINIKLFIFGTNYEASIDYIKLVKKLKLDDIIEIINDYTFSNGKLSEFLKNNCDLALGNFGDSEKSKNVIVNKLIESVSMKVPVLTGESIAPRDFFNHNTIFYCNNTPDSIAKAIIKIHKTSKNEILERINKSHHIYSMHFTPDSLYDKLNSIFK